MGVSYFATLKMSGISGFISKQEMGKIQSPSHLELSIRHKQLSSFSRASL